MLKLIVPLCLIASAGFVTQPESSLGQSKTKTTVAVIDYGKVLKAETGIQPYAYAKDGTVVVAKLDDKQVKAVSESLVRLKAVVQAIAEQHNIGLVLRMDSKPDTPEQVFSFHMGITRLPIALPLASDNDSDNVDQLRASLHQDLNTRIVLHRKLDLTSMVIQAMQATRPPAGDVVR